MAAWNSGRRFTIYVIAIHAVASFHVFGFQPLSPHLNSARRIFPFFAKRNKKNRNQDIAGLNNWYDDVDPEEAPNNAFWEEMSRQRMLTQLGEQSRQSPMEAGPMDSPFGGGGGNSALNPSPLGGIPGGEVGLAGPSMYEGEDPYYGSRNPKKAQNKLDQTALDTLNKYQDFMVEDNWLDEDLVDAMIDWDELLELGDQEEEEESVEMPGTAIEEPWEAFDKPPKKDGEVDRLVLEPNYDSKYLFTDPEDLDPEDDKEGKEMEAELLERLSKIKISSERLEAARKSPKATKFFQREPDAIDGFDQMWVSAIEQPCFRNLQGNFRNFGVQFADNFGDWVDGCYEDSFASVEDVASFKARKVYEVTGLPCVSSRTSFEIEPVPPPQQRVPRQPPPNPKVNSGYRFNDVGMHVEHMIKALKPVSEASRVTRYHTCLCYYDGEMEVYEYGTCDIDLEFANLDRTFISVSTAIAGMTKILKISLGLEWMKWLNEDSRGNIGPAVRALRDRVLRDGKVLPNDIVDVSAFMDSMVDVDLMDDCAKELVERFVDERPTKILTVATTGLVIAIPMAKYLNVPCVYARKERNMVMADTYRATYNSKTVGKNRELFVSKAHLDEYDRVLVVDDFLSGGSSQEALLRIIGESGATPVGVGVLIEKVYDSGRRSLSGFDVPVHSVVSVASVAGGVIQLVEEDGYQDMMNSK